MMTTSGEDDGSGRANSASALPVHPANGNHGRERDPSDSSSTSNRSNGSGHGHSSGSGSPSAPSDALFLYGSERDGWDLHTLKQLALQFPSNESLLIHAWQQRWSCLKWGRVAALQRSLRQSSSHAHKHSKHDKRMSELHSHGATSNAHPNGSHVGTDREHRDMDEHAQEDSDQGEEHDASLALAKAILQQLCIGPKPSASLIDYLKHAVGAHLITPSHALSLLPQFARTERRHQFAAFTEIALHILLTLVHQPQLQPPRQAPDHHRRGSSTHTPPARNGGGPSSTAAPGGSSAFFAKAEAEYSSHRPPPASLPAYSSGSGQATSTAATVLATLSWLLEAASTFCGQLAVSSQTPAALQEALQSLQQTATAITAALGDSRAFSICYVAKFERKDLWLEISQHLRPLYSLFMRDPPFSSSSFFAAQSDRLDFLRPLWQAILPLFDVTNTVFHRSRYDSPSSTFTSKDLCRLTASQATLTGGLPGKGGTPYLDTVHFFHDSQPHEFHPPEMSMLSIPLYCQAEVSDWQLSSLVESVDRWDRLFCVKSEPAEIFFFEMLRCSLALLSRVVSSKQPPFAQCAWVLTTFVKIPLIISQLAKGLQQRHIKRFFDSETPLSERFPVHAALYRLSTSLECLDWCGSKLGIDALGQLALSFSRSGLLCLHVEALEVFPVRVPSMQAPGAFSPTRFVSSILGDMGLHKIDWPATENDIEQVCDSICSDEDTDAAGAFAPRLLRRYREIPYCHIERTAQLTIKLTARLASKPSLLLTLLEAALFVEIKAIFASAFQLANAIDALASTCDLFDKAGGDAGSHLALAIFNSAFSLLIHLSSSHPAKTLGIIHPRASVFKDWLYLCAERRLVPPLSSIAQEIASSEASDSVLYLPAAPVHALTGFDDFYSSSEHESSSNAHQDDASLHPNDSSVSTCIDRLFVNAENEGEWVESLRLHQPSVVVNYILPRVIHHAVFAVSCGAFAYSDLYKGLLRVFARFPCTLASVVHWLCDEVDDDETGVWKPGRWHDHLEEDLPLPALIVADIVSMALPKQEQENGDQARAVASTSQQRTTLLFAIAHRVLRSRAKLNAFSIFKALWRPMLQHFTDVPHIRAHALAVTDGELKTRFTADLQACVAAKQIPFDFATSTKQCYAVSGARNFLHMLTQFIFRSTSLTEGRVSSDFAAAICVRLDEAGPHMLASTFFSEMAPEVVSSLQTSVAAKSLAHFACRLATLGGAGSWGREEADHGESTDATSLASDDARARTAQFQQAVKNCAQLRHSAPAHTAWHRQHVVAHSLSKLMSTVADALDGPAAFPMVFGLAFLVESARVPGLLHTCKAPSIARICGSLHRLGHVTLIPALFDLASSSSRRECLRHLCAESAGEAASGSA